MGSDRAEGSAFKHLMRKGCRKWPYGILRVPELAARRDDAEAGLDYLGPVWITLGHGWIAQERMDQRCSRTIASDAAPLIDSVTL